MGFEAILGNQRLKDNLSRSLETGHISHFYLISGPEGSGRHTLARELAAGILCRSGQDRPCGHCKACRKVRNASHPDFITVDDPEKKTVPVDLIRQARADIYVQPNESAYKIYLFPRAMDMGVPGQNALLKILEEPPKYGVFLLITDNPEKLLSTVRSRCTELAMSPLDENTLISALKAEFPQANAEDIRSAAVRSGGFLGQAKALLSQGTQIPPQTLAFAESFAARDALGLTRVLTPMEKWKRDQLIPMLESWTELLESALAFRSQMPAVSALARDLGTRRSPRDLSDAITALKKATAYAQGNISVAAVCGWLSWELR